MAAATGTQSGLPASFTQLVSLAGRGGGGGGKLQVAGSEYGGLALFMGADEQRLSKLLVEKHSPDGRRLDIGYLLNLVEDIFRRATQTVNKGTEAQATSPSTSTGWGLPTKPASKFDSFPDLPLTIERVACEMGCKCLGGAEAHDATVSVLDILARHPWEAKLVLTLAAFSVNYGEFLLLNQIYATNSLAKSMASLKQLPPSILQGDFDETLKRQLEAIGGLIRVMLDVTKLVVDFSQLSSTDYVTPDEPALKAVLAHLPITVYWIIRSTVAAATQITMITTTTTPEFMPSTTELELANWANNLKQTLEFLQKMKNSVQNVINAKLEEEDYKNIWKIIFDIIHQDNMTVIQTLISSKELPLFDGATGKRVELNVLFRKTVLLLITGPDVDQDQLTMLTNIYKEPMEQEYTIVWVPVVDPSIKWTDLMQSKLGELQSMMPWYSVYNPSIISRATIRFFQENLSFKGKPILVSLDTQGKITSNNALPMLWIWKNKASPFSTAKEGDLWKKESPLKLELLVDNIDPTISKWMKDDKYIFVYGGEDIEWIKKFTKLAKDVATAAKINLELVYVGKSCKRETVRKITDIMKEEKLGYYLQDDIASNNMWYFWTRLESMLSSKIQLGKVDDASDKVTQEIKKIISYDKNVVGGWAVICKGSQAFTSVPGTTICESLGKYEEWKGKVVEGGINFKDVLIETIKDGAGSDDTCFRFEFPVSGGKIPEAMKCPGCQNHMENYITFVCCHDGGAPLANAAPRSLWLD